MCLCVVQSEELSRHTSSQLLLSRVVQIVSGDRFCRSHTYGHQQVENKRDLAIAEVIMNQSTYKKSGKTAEAAKQYS
jgi:hypothetical protein